MCCLVLGSRYCFAIPKSTTWMTARPQTQMGKLSGPNGRTVSRLGARPANQEVVGLDVTVDEVLLVYSLNTSDLWQPPFSVTAHAYAARICARTICRAAMHTVLIENLRPHMSNRSSKLGPRRSMTRMLCRPSCPQWYIWGIPAVHREEGELVEMEGEERRGRRRGTDGIRRVYDMSGIRLVVVGLLLSAVPTEAKDDRRRRRYERHVGT